MALGQCPSALNAGVNLLLTPNTTAMTQKAGMLALDGRCKTLSPAADGYARADACGVMLLLPTGSGANGGRALALLAGTAVNQDGRSSSLTAPNGPSQQEVVYQALGAARLEPFAVTALQMHGTGESDGTARPILTIRCLFPPLIDACSCGINKAAAQSGGLCRHLAGRPY